MHTYIHICICMYMNDADAEDVCDIRPRLCVGLCCTSVSVSLYGSWA